MLAILAHGVDVDLEATNGTRLNPRRFEPRRVALLGIVERVRGPCREGASHLEDEERVYFAAFGPALRRGLLLPAEPRRDCLGADAREERRGATHRARPLEGVIIMSHRESRIDASTSVVCRGFEGALLHHPPGPEGNTESFRISHLALMDQTGDPHGPKRPPNFKTIKVVKTLQHSQNSHGCVHLNKSGTFAGVTPVPPRRTGVTFDSILLHRSHFE